jgi:hypothetical protein
MADQHNDNVPAVPNVIVTDIGKIKETLEYHKDVFQAITTGWSNTTTANILPTRTVTTFSSETTKTISSLVAAGVYRVSMVLDSDADNSLHLRFNADSGANYVVLNRYEYDGTSALIGTVNGATEEQITIHAIGLSGTHVVNLIFAASPGDTTRVLVNFNSSFRRVSTSYYGFRHGMGFYDGGSALTSFTIASASNLTGTMFTERIA